MSIYDLNVWFQKLHIYASLLQLCLYTVCFLPVPSSPRDVTVQATSLSSVLVTWQPPETINGILDSYVVRIMEEVSTTPLLSRIVNAEGATSGGSVVIRGLELGTYTVTVVAETGAGEGDTSDPLPFTLMTSKIDTV